jgi:sugar phosphate isomerase/epimerase
MEGGMTKKAFEKIAAGLHDALATITEENRHDEVRVSPPTDEVSRLREVLEHITELLVDTWHTAMDGDPEKEAAVVDARAELSRFSTQQGGN